ncbi:helix-turn-helix protein [Falsiruegeria litorea R37]|uniref:Helix-turn-helix protein n=1 Tax=Falsiruegeria litorea R37 TaxID=1200284 RepID=A0A1Y5S6E9_9RHOB|nr:helix-turn-helix transcriptional regulator [Falsiruegeria litorea]SLN32296.1 helix-turn-helix protein [Falsiruegeria litorea R37]
MEENALRDKIAALIEIRKRGRVELSLAIKKSRSYLTNYLNGTDGQEPSFETMCLLAKELGVSVSYFDDTDNEFEAASASELDRQAAHILTGVYRAARTKMLERGARPTLDMVLGWWQETGGKLVHCDQIIPFVDLVSPVDFKDNAPSVAHVGKKSLSAKALKSEAAEKLQLFLNSLSYADMNELKRTVTTVHQSRIGILAPQSRTVPDVNGGPDLQVEFVRLMLPVTDANDTPYVLNFSTLVSASSPKNN